MIVKNFSILKGFKIDNGALRHYYNNSILIKLFGAVTAPYTELMHSTKWISFGFNISRLRLQ
jgi:hypothetical protein